MKKTILILGAGEEQTIAIKLAQEMGIKVIAVDGNPNAIGLKIADFGVCADVNDIELITKIAKENNADGVMTHAVEIPQVVATVAKARNLPGVDPEVAERATNKLKRIKCFEKEGVPHPKFETATNIEEAVRKSETIGFPLVMKPIDNAGARGVTNVNAKNEIERAFKEALSLSKEEIVLLEEYLEGPEISTESVVYNGKIYTPCWGDRNYDNKDKYYPYMIEDGGALPPKLSFEGKNLIEKTVKRAIRALGINFGAAKGDILIHRGKPYILEMAARSSGGRFCDTKVPLSNGVNILKPLIQMHLGEEVDLKELEPKYERGVAERAILPDPGNVISIKGVEEVKRMDGIYKVYIKPEIKVGSFIEPLKNNADKIGYVIALGKTRDQAVQRAEQAVEVIKLITKSE
jgi:biotin carboxylase